MTISEYYNKALQIELEDIFAEAIRENEESLVDINQKQLYELGMDSNGLGVGTYKVYDYAFEKNNRNPLPGFGNVDLFYTGAFYGGFYIEADTEGFAIYSSDSKAPKLINIYGLNIFGITKENLAAFVESYYRAAFIKKIYDKLAA